MLLEVAKGAIFDLTFSTCCYSKATIALQTRSVSQNKILKFMADSGPCPECSAANAGKSLDSNLAS